MWERLIGRPERPGRAPERAESPKGRFLSVFWLQKGTPGPPAPRRVLQQGPRDARATTLGFRVYTFTPPWAAVAQLYLGSMTLFAAREARAASGSAWRLSSPQLRL